jgi:hypothetical protein
VHVGSNRYHRFASSFEFAPVQFTWTRGGTAVLQHHSERSEESAFDGYPYIQAALEKAGAKQ